ncbi:MAG: cyclic pyranopterin phosphate synthase MoaA [Elusimicrobia bacterium RIFOXYD12_FULL_66_9]|nr:MAG: cyclic pyranopterin phosphate synthase MoaA [Elusimicrobia bacterium RIFOXYD12_FULL_66_9]
MTDSFGRRIDYLRLSVTDRCNLRCQYCLPEHHAGFAPAPDILTPDEIERVVRIFAAAGVSRVRLTGGEPLVRTDIIEIVERLARVPGLSDLSMSTNGVLLAPLARPLVRAGLRRVNISLDSLDAERFRSVTRFGRLDEARAGLDAALAAGLSPVKLNMVVARGLNEDEVDAFAALTQEAPLHVRFIELMPMGETGFFSKERWVPLAEIMAAAGPLEPLSDAERPVGHGPARYHRRPGARGSIGFISALSCGFCASCNRLRLTSSGLLVPCLDGEAGIDLRGPLRRGAGDAELRRLLEETVRANPREHAMAAKAEAAASNPRLMCSIGG